MSQYYYPQHTTEWTCKYHYPETKTEDQFAHSSLNFTPHNGDFGVVLGIPIYDYFLYKSVAKKLVNNTYPYKFPISFSDWTNRNESCDIDALRQNLETGLLSDSTINTLNNYLTSLYPHYITDRHSQQSKAHNHPLENIINYHRFIDTNASIEQIAYNLAVLLTGWPCQDLPNDLKDTLIEMFGEPVIDLSLTFNILPHNITNKPLCNYSEYYFAKSPCLKYGYPNTNMPYLFISAKGHREPIVFTNRLIKGAKGLLLLPGVLYVPEKSSATYNQIILANAQVKLEQDANTHSITNNDEPTATMPPRLRSIYNTQLNLIPLRPYNPQNLQSKLDLENPKDFYHRKDRNYPR